MCSGDIYSPRIAEDLIPHLFRLARDKDVAMTKVVDEILRTDLHIRGIINDEEAQRNQGRRVKRMAEGQEIDP
jgi:hypothetical protein